MSRLLNRRFWNPVLVLSGSLVLISGVFLLFHLVSRPIMVIHELGGLVFLVACIAHVIMNRQPLMKTIGSRATACALFAVILLAGLGMASSDVEHKHEHIRKKIVGEMRMLSR